MDQQPQPSTSKEPEKPEDSPAPPIAAPTQAISSPERARLLARRHAILAEYKIEFLALLICVKKAEDMCKLKNPTKPDYPQPLIATRKICEFLGKKDNDPSLDITDKTLSLAETFLKRQAKTQALAPFIKEVEEKLKERRVARMQSLENPPSSVESAQSSSSSTIIIGSSDDEVNKEIIDQQKKDTIPPLIKLDVKSTETPKDVVQPSRTYVDPLEKALHGLVSASRDAIYKTNMYQYVRTNQNTFAPALETLGLFSPAYIPATSSRSSKSSSPKTITIYDSRFTFSLYSASPSSSTVTTSSGPFRLPAQLGIHFVNSTASLPQVVLNIPVEYPRLPAHIEFEKYCWESHPGLGLLMKRFQRRAIHSQKHHKGNYVSLLDLLHNCIEPYLCSFDTQITCSL